MRVAVVTAASGAGYGDLRGEVAMIKASLLYADDVQLVSGKLPMLYIQTSEQMRGFRDLVEEVRHIEAQGVAAVVLEGIRARNSDVAERFQGIIEQADSFAVVVEAMAAVWEETLLPLVSGAPHERHLQMLEDFLPGFVETYSRRAGVPAEPLTAAARELQAAAQAGVVTFDLLEAQDTFRVDVDAMVWRTLMSLIDAIVVIAERPEGVYPLFDDRARHLLEQLEHPVQTTAAAPIADALIGSLESFPMASIDVILDVRERLRPATSRFRAAMVTYAQEFATTRDTREFAAFIEDLRVREIDPAITEIKESLEELNARDTLLRGWPKAAAGVIGLAAAATLKAPELAQYVPVATGLSVAFATEIAKRRQTFRGNEHRQLFFLHAAERYLAERIEDTARR